MSERIFFCSCLGTGVEGSATDGVLGQIRALSYDRMPDVTMIRTSCHKDVAECLPEVLNGIVSDVEWSRLAKIASLKDETGIVARRIMDCLRVLPFQEVDGVEARAMEIFPPDDWVYSNAILVKKK